MPAKGRPLIGVTPWYDYPKDTAYIKSGYCEGVVEAGGLPVLMPFTADEDILTDVIDRLDGFLVSGGPDLDAKYYNEENMPYNGDISPERDMMELFVVKRAVEVNKPVFGICRGIQVMNVALGGSLYQDIYSQVKDRELIQHSQAAPKWYPTHDIRIEKGSKVWSSFNRDRARVNTFHHQAVKQVAPGFKVTSRSSDGIVESIELEGHIFAVGVQWHPELMWQKNPEFLNIFRSFVECCRVKGDGSSMTQK
ncbi:MAG: gamma-glutamyl-gamma-aminobutyrate hydrolase family protein [Clostridiales bacterium]|nr:gamma-glutamyl-gamma-aminobutyrate hydrolase family protein [Eubacteriales bacterium]MDH7567561.1 gamma-glutamyl-gamma-aminobutyrate hydrolase family protein [Clostridiales bacterium]